MTWRHTNRSQADYDDVQKNIQKAFDKQVTLLSQNLLHPSLHAKKYDESANLWQARVNKDWRFYFTIEGDTYIIARIVPHPK